MNLLAPHLKKIVTFSSPFMLAFALLISGTQASSAFADTAPAAGAPATVSSDLLPTEQINGVVYAQTIVNDIDYATGSFTSARPAGSAAGTNETPRANLVAINVNDGTLVSSFNYSLNAEGRSLAASPDGTKLYVGGQFTTVNGAPHQHIAEINLSNNTLVTGFTGGVSSTVSALAATNTEVYAGGLFSTASNGTITRSHLAAFSSTGALLAWNPSANGDVAAIVIVGSRVIVGGSFSTLSGKAYHGSGAVSPTSTGAPVAWASTSSTYAIRDDNVHAGITSLTYDGTYVYLTAFNYGGTKSGGFEGRAGINPSTGAIVWVDDCHGDTYDAYPINGVLYSVGHAHDCQPAGAFPDTNPRSFHYALAQSTKSTGGKNGAPTENYNSFSGTADTAQLVWYPSFGIGSYTGLSQSTWSITGNSNYVIVGGEFPSVNGVAQEGLARFAIPSIAPDKVGPANWYTTGTGTSNVVSSSPVQAGGTNTVTWPATWDQDNGTLTYVLYRDGTPIYSVTKDSRFWNLPTMVFHDSGLAVGSTHVYKVIATDPNGNSATAYNNTPTGCQVAGGTTGTLCVGQKLTIGQSLVSPNGSYTLSMQTDGNLVLRNKAGTAIWYTKTNGTANANSYLTLQTDGNLVVYNHATLTGVATWNAKTSGKKSYRLSLQSDGNLVIYPTSGAAIWSTHTNGK